MRPPVHWSNWRFRPTTHRRSSNLGDPATLGGGRHHPHRRTSLLGTLSSLLDLAASQSAPGDRPLPHRRARRPSRLLYPLRISHREKWLAKRQQELLPVQYFHLVFSVPHTLVPLMWQNKKILFSLLFEASAATLLEVAADPKHLGAEIGFFSILHTWGQTLQPHPHIHCVVPGGG